MKRDLTFKQRMFLIMFQTAIGLVMQHKYVDRLAEAIVTKRFADKLADAMLNSLQRREKNL